MKIKNVFGMIFAYVVLMGLLASCSAMSADKKPKVYNFNYERFEFYNGDIAMELPNDPRSEVTALYYKVLADKYIDLTMGRFEISIVDLDKYRGSRNEELENKLVVKHEGDDASIFRMAFWNGKNPIVLTVGTSESTNTFSTAAERDERIRKDDEIFDHIVESFKYRKEDGTHAKPEIVRQADEEKDTSQK